MTPRFHPLLVRWMARVTAKPQKQKGSRHAHVNRIPPQSCVADYRSHSQGQEGLPCGLCLGPTFEPIGMPKLHRNLQFSGPLMEIGNQLRRVLRRKVGRKLNEGWASLFAQGQHAFYKVIGGANTIVKAAVMANDRRKLWTKPKVFGHGLRPLCHPFWRMDPVVRGIQFYGAKRRTIMNRPRALRLLCRVHRSSPRTNGPHGSTSTDSERSLWAQP